MAMRLASDLDVDNADHMLIPPRTMLEYFDQSSRSLGVAGIRAKSGLTGSEAITRPNIQDPLLDVLQPPPQSLLMMSECG
jgi:hypothetical protein